MNQGFWIRSITFTGELVQASSVEFKPGFNIIHGPSDTGKTYLASSIKYMLAGGAAPFSSATGYNRISMVLETEKGQVTLSRDLQSRNITVHAPGYGAIGEFPAVPTKGDPDAYSVSDLLLACIGVTERRMVVSNQYGTRQLLTWRTFADVLHRSESRITSQESIFSKDKCETLSAALTLFYDEDFLLVPEYQDPTTVKATANILTGQLQRMLEYTLAKIDELKEQTPEDTSELETELSGYLAQYAQLQETNSSYRQRLQTLTHDLTELTRLKTQKEVALTQYEDLATIYVGNLERLDAIAEAEQHLALVPAPTNCPYCQAPLSEHQSETVAAAAHQEALNAATNLRDLVEQRDVTNAEISGITQKISELESEQSDIESHLSGELFPAIRQIEEAIEKFNSAHERERELSFYQNQYQMLMEELERVPTPTDSKNLYEPAKLFPHEFYEQMTKNLQDILSELSFPDAENARFDMDDFDVRINGKRKRSHGKGMCALLNTVVMLALQKYISEHAIHKPSVLVIDTPTLGLEHQSSGDNLITSRDEVTGRPRTGLLRQLFDYMHDAGQYGQIIILNNTDVTPTTRFDTAEASELIFGSMQDAQRPGLLHDIREEYEA